MRDAATYSMTVYLRVFLSGVVLFALTAFSGMIYDVFRQKGLLLGWRARWLLVLLTVMAAAALGELWIDR